MGNSLEPKKLALLRILTILEQYSDYNHPLKQEDILKYLEKDYGIVLERKAVGRNISMLKDAGIEISATRDGSYLEDRTFLDAELRMLIDSVLCSRHITAKHSKDLIERLCGLSNKFFKPHVKHVFSVNDWNKTENPALFYNIELIDTAIEENKQVTFDFNCYGLDKKLHKTANHQVSPYQMIIHNQKYYLMGLHEKYKRISYYRLDHITNLKITEDKLTPIRSVKGYENGIDYKRLSATLPYLFNDPIENIEFIADKALLDQIFEWFGTDVRVVDQGNETLLVSLESSPKAMEHWAMQYCKYVEVTKPAKLRQQIRESAELAAAKHQ